MNLLPSGWTDLEWLQTAMLLRINMPNFHQSLISSIERTKVSMHLLQLTGILMKVQFTQLVSFKESKPSTTNSWRLNLMFNLQSIKPEPDLKLSSLSMLQLFIISCFGPSTTKCILPKLKPWTTLVILLRCLTVKPWNTFHLPPSTLTDNKRSEISLHKIWLRTPKSPDFTLNFLGVVFCLHHSDILKNTTLLLLLPSPNWVSEQFTNTLNLFKTFKS